MRFMHPNARLENQKQLHPVLDIGAGKFNTVNHEIIDIENPDPDTINIHDIAHGLSNICRFGGHTTRFYSVAQHSCLVSYLAPKQLRLEALLHDAAEAYLGDVIKPLKVLIERSSGYKRYEDNFQRLIATKFHIDPAAFGLVKPFDLRALEIEHGYFFLNEEKHFSKLFNSEEPCWTPTIAKEVFLSTFNELAR